MADKKVVKNRTAERRRRRVRAKVFGTGQRPRLTVNKSLKNLTAQIIDDDKRITLVGVATNSAAFKDVIKKDDSKTAVAEKLGAKVAELAKEKGVEAVIFDRNQYLYHGRIKAVADGARKGGLKF